MLRFPQQGHGGRAKDGEAKMSLEVSEPVAGVERVAGGRVACSQSLAAAGAAGGHSFCPGTPHRHLVAPRRRCQRRLPGLLLLPCPTRTQEQIGRHTALDAVASRIAASRSAAGGDRRLAHQTVRTARRRGRHPSQSHARAGHRRGWQTIQCVLYNETATKTCKTFLATYRPVGGVIRVVLVKEKHGWFAFFSTDPNASVAEILEAFADRATIEQDFHDVKEVWGAGQQQVRNIWTNVAVYHLNLWMHTLVELWAWDQSHAHLCDRSDSPWDEAERRPSHADRRKALRRKIMRNELSNVTAVWRLPRKILQLVESLMALAA